jgi:RNase adaptor protein for sRNA GlmZ degradation
MGVRIITFGYLHGGAPGAHVTLDLRTHFKDPHVSPALRHMTAHDAEVRAAVAATPGIAALVEATVAAVLAYRSGPSAGPVTVAVGCAGGRHRAATVGMRLAQILADSHAVPVTLAHRDLTKDVVNR